MSYQTAGGGPFMEYVSATHQAAPCQRKTTQESRRKKLFGKRCRTALPNAAILACNRSIHDEVSGVDKQSRRNSARSHTGTPEPVPHFETLPPVGRHNEKGVAIQPDALLVRHPACRVAPRSSVLSSHARLRKPDRFRSETGSPGPHRASIAANRSQATSPGPRHRMSCCTVHS